MISRFQELEILNSLDFEREDQAQAFGKLQEFRKMGLFFHAADGA
jgi:hypothetical protein